jgi:hypothetical protein
MTELSRNMSHLYLWHVHKEKFVTYLCLQATIQIPWWSFIKFVIGEFYLNLSMYARADQNRMAVTDTVCYAYAQ